MKKISLILVITIMVSLLAACSSNGAIQPGDKVAGFTFIEGGEEAIQKVLQNDQTQACTQQESENVYLCQIATGEKWNIAVGIYSDLSSGASLETKWDEHTIEIFVNDRPVDVAAFGTVDMMHPRVGPMRWHDIAIQADKPGEIVVRTKGVVDGETFEDTTTFKASEP